MVVVEIFVIEEGEILFGESFSFILFINECDKKVYYAGSEVKELINLLLREAYEELV
jgi:hypothetical protein